MKVLQNKKGFTLIEIIIVIVIIAILAAMLVPAMLKWVDKSRQRTFLSACDSIRTAVAAQITEDFAEGGTGLIGTNADNWGENGEISKLVNATVNYQATPGQAAKGQYNVGFSVSDGRITELIICDNQYTATFDGTKWSAVDKVATT